MYFRARKSKLSDSKIITIIIAFHFGQFANFKAFYLLYVRDHCQDLFPDLVSYDRFIEIQKKVAIPMLMFLKMKSLGKCTGISFIDSTHMKVCHNQRIHNHKTFKDIAERGQYSIGWFYGFKLHLIISDKGDILSFYLTKGNVDGRNLKAMTSMIKELSGKLVGDKYI